MEDLLAIRDGEGSAAARQHLELCAECRTEYELLHQRVAALKALSSFSPPRDRWPAVKEALVAERRRRWLVGWVTAAAAASVAVFFGVRVLPPQQRSAGAPGTEGQVSLEELVSRSQMLEDALRSLDPTSRVLSGRAASAIADLEDQIALLDAHLAEAQANRAEPSVVRELWAERVRLLDALVRVHTTRATYVGL
jgi:hypothetical protein